MTSTGRSSALFVLAFVVLAASPAGAQLSAGFARADITPDKNVPLAGYSVRKGRLGTGVHDRVYAEALAIQSGEARVTLVSLDLVGVYSMVRDDIVARVNPKYGVTAVNTLIGGTNNHSGPGAVLNAERLPSMASIPPFLKRFALRSVEASAGKFDPELYERLITRVARAIEKAHDAMVPARIGFGASMQKRFNRNKVDINGTRDTELGVMRVETAAGRLLGMVVTYAITPSCVHWGAMEISAGIPGFVRAAVRRELGDNDAGFLWFSGASADAGYALRRTGNEQEPVPENYGAVLDKPDRVELRDVEAAPLPPEEQIARSYVKARAIADGLGSAVVRVLRFTRAKDKAPISVRMPEADMPSGKNLYSRFVPRRLGFQTVELGNALIMALPGEASMAIALNLKRQARALGYRRAWVLNLVGDYAGYFIHPAAYEKRYRRWRTLKQSAGYGPEVAPLIERTILGPLGLQRTSYDGGPAPQILAGPGGAERALDLGGRLAADLGRLQQNLAQLGNRFREQSRKDIETLRTENARTRPRKEMQPTPPAVQPRQPTPAEGPDDEEEGF